MARKQEKKGRTKATTGEFRMLTKKKRIKEERRGFYKEKVSFDIGNKGKMEKS